MRDAKHLESDARNGGLAVILNLGRYNSIKTVGALMYMIIALVLAVIAEIKVPIYLPMRYTNHVESDRLIGLNIVLLKVEPELLINRERRG